MARDTGATMKPITLVSAFRHSILATQRHTRVISHFVLYFQLGRVRTYTDFCAWHNNYGILATDIKWHRYNWQQCSAARAVYSL